MAMLATVCKNSTSEVIYKKSLCGFGKLLVV